MCLHFAGCHASHRLGRRQNRIILWADTESMWGGKTGDETYSLLVLNPFIVNVLDNTATLRNRPLLFRNLVHVRVFTIYRTFSLWVPAASTVAAHSIGTLKVSWFRLAILQVAVVYVRFLSAHSPNSSDVCPGSGGDIAVLSSKELFHSCFNNSNFETTGNVQKQALVSMLTVSLTAQAQAKEEQVYGAVNLKMSTANISKWVSISSRKFCCCLESHMLSQTLSHPPLYFSIMSEEWFQWQTMAPTPMAPSFSSHTPNSPTWIWSTQCLESMSSLSVEDRWTHCLMSPVLLSLSSYSPPPHTESSTAWKHWMNLKSSLSMKRRSGRSLKLALRMWQYMPILLRVNHLEMCRRIFSRSGGLLQPLWSGWITAGQIGRNPWGINKGGKKTLPETVDCQIKLSNVLYHMISQLQT